MKIHYQIFKNSVFARLPLLFVTAGASINAYANNDQQMALLIFWCGGIPALFNDITDKHVT